MSPNRLVVIGAGAAGAATAAAAARLGATVTVVEREGVAAGSSGLSAGIFTTTYADPLELELRIFSVREIRRLAREADVPVVGNGFLRLARGDADMALFRRALVEQRRRGIDDSRVLDAAEIVDIVPHLRLDDIVGALWAPSDGYTDGHALCTAWLEEARGLGASYLRAELVGAELGPPHVLTTTAGELECETIVNAAGAWAGLVADRLGCSLPLCNERHQLLLAHLSEPLRYVMPTVMDYVPGSGKYGLYFRHEGDDTRLLVGLHSNEAGLEPVADPDSYQRSVDHAFVEEIAEQLLHRLPSLSQTTLGQGYAGLYPCIRSADRLLPARFLRTAVR
jgi:sarcosine oxidase subunit beta